MLSPQTWLSALAYFGILAGLYSFGLFVSSSRQLLKLTHLLVTTVLTPILLQLPTIIEALGYTANQAQLWSVIPYAVASLLTVCVAFASDRFQLRGVLMLCTLPIAIIGYAGIAFVSDPRVKYGMTMLMATGLYCSVPPVLSWLSNNSAGHYKRATTSALQLAIANCGGFVAVSLALMMSLPFGLGIGRRRKAWKETMTDSLPFSRSSSIPRLKARSTSKATPPFWASSAVAGFCKSYPQTARGENPHHHYDDHPANESWHSVLLNVLYCHKLNRDKARGKYDQYTGCGDDRDPAFKFVL